MSFRHADICLETVAESASCADEIRLYRSSVWETTAGGKKHKKKNYNPKEYGFACFLFTGVILTDSVGL